jgi:hypothetical protein
MQFPEAIGTFYCSQMSIVPGRYVQLILHWRCSVLLSMPKCCGLYNATPASNHCTNLMRTSNTKQCNSRSIMKHPFPTPFNIIFNTQKQLESLSRWGWRWRWRSCISWWGRWRTRARRGWWWSAGTLYLSATHSQSHV